MSDPNRYSGHGGYLVFVPYTPGTRDEGSDYYVVHNITYEPSVEGKTPEMTDSSSQGAADGIGKVSTAQVTAECNDDQEGALDLVGVAVLTRGNLYLRRGELEKFDLVQGCLWGGISRTNDNQEGGSPRVRLTFRYGRVATWGDKTALPTGLRGYLEGLDPPLLTP